MSFPVFYFLTPLLSTSHIFDMDTILFKFSADIPTPASPNRASSLGMMSEEEKKLQRIEDIKELLS